MAYLPCIFFRAKCFAETPIHVLYHKHYEALWAEKPFKTERGAMNFAKRQIEYDPDVWQLPATKKA